MRALQYRKFGGPPELVDVPRPTPRPGELLLKVTAAGVCHSDVWLMGLPLESYPFGELPLTLGHEGAGVVVQLGEGVHNVSVGESVAVYGPWGCGRCLHCAQGKENYCSNARADGIRAPGLGAPGAMAEYMIVDDARHVVPLGGLDPVAHVSLTDAGLTAYHVVKRSAAALGAGTTAVVVGAGGLGHAGIQILRALTGATVVVLDVDDDKLELARRVGAHHALHSDEQAPDAVRALTGGAGADAVFDFVGTDRTLQTAAAAAAVEGDIWIVGIGGRRLAAGFGTVAYEVAVRTTYWGSRSELIEVLQMARRGQLSLETEVYSLQEAPAAYQRLQAGLVLGRAVVVPQS